jgi:hypothetical protein
MKKWTRLLCITLSFLPSASLAEQNSVPPSIVAPAYIGICWMENDGTIVLWLRAEAPGGIVGHSLLRYPPDHPEYQGILDHVGPLKPGDTISVRPWPD